MAVSFTAGDPIKEHQTTADQWDEITLPAGTRVFTVNNEDAADEAIVAFVTVDGGGNAINAADNFVKVPANGQRIFDFSLGKGRDRQGVPTSMFVGAEAANSPLTKLEAQ